MTRRSRILAAAVLGLSLAPLAVRAADPPVGGKLPPLPPAQARTDAPPAAATPAPAGAPAAPTALGLEKVPPAKPTTNQEVVAAVADCLRQAGRAGQLRHYNLDVVVKDGTTELSGTVASEQQRADVLKLVKAVPGVVRVVDKMALLAPNPIAQVQATAPGAPVSAPPAPQAPPAPPQVAPPPVPELAPPPLREPLAPPNPAAGVIPEPVPTFVAPVPSPYDLNPPLMPPYAWPTYAPYRLSRVAYPLNYPYQSWPYIGPCYPFPKIPPGWRSVKLEWEDGHWWYSRVATQNGYWRLRFW